jgi:hypothetical protein
VQDSVAGNAVIVAIVPGLDAAGDLGLFIPHILHQFLPVYAGDDPVYLWQRGHHGQSRVDMGFLFVLAESIALTPLPE